MNRRPEDTIWGWGDAVLFIGTFPPAFILATVVARSVRAISGDALGKAGYAMLAQFAWWGFAFAGLWAILRFRHEKPFWKTLGFGSPGWKEMSIAIAAGPLISIGVALVIQHIGVLETKNPFYELLDSKRAAIIIGFSAIVLGPLCEELAFRGFFQPLLCRTLGPVAGMTMSAAPFAIMHGPQYGWAWRHLMLLLLVGLAFAWQRFRTGSTLVSAATHGSYNAFMFFAYLATEGDMLGRW
jgi:membrane protease YdiL (CAAX protease family)